MNTRLRKAIRMVPGYQLARRRYRSWSEPEFKEREQLRSWITTGMELQDRLGLQPILFEDGKAFARSRDGLEYWWNPDLDGAILDLEFGSDFEKLELECILSFLESARDQRSVFLDIGGNCGLHSFTVARRFPASHIFCFEPVPSSQTMIRINAEHNSLSDQITLVGKALGDEIRSVQMTASYSAMDHLIVGNASDELSPLIVEVEMITLDSFVADHPLERIDFIKCDVEGAELLVFKGAQETLARFRPPILLEIESRHTKRFGYLPEDLDAFLRSFGYAPSLPSPIDRPAGLRSLGEGIEQGHNNFLYLQQEGIG